MLELLIEFKDIFTPILSEITQALVQASIVFICALAVVYVVGRMFDLVHTDRLKNFIALLLIVGLNYAYSNLFYTIDDLSYKIWDVFVNSCLSTVLYVLIGFKIYDRVDNLLDKKIAPDKQEPKPKKKTKSKVKK